MGYFKFFEHLLKPTYYGSYFGKFYELKKTLYRVWMTIPEGYDVQSFTLKSLHLKIWWSSKVRKIKKTT